MDPATRECQDPLTYDLLFHEVDTLAKQLADWKITNQDDVEALDLCTVTVFCSKSGQASDTKQWLVRPLDCIKLCHFGHNHKPFEISLSGDSVHFNTTGTYSIEVTVESSEEKSPGTLRLHYSHLNGTSFTRWTRTNDTWKGLVTNGTSIKFESLGYLKLGGTTVKITKLRDSSPNSSPSASIQFCQ